jgi:predicted phage tail component-like protein
VVGRHGEYDYGFTFAGRTIQLDCLITALSETDLRRRVRDIAAWLNPAKGERYLVLDTEPDKYYKARFAGEAEVEIVARQGRTMLSFHASDPFAYGSEIQVTFNNDAVNVNNPGTFETYPRFEVTFTSTTSEWRVALGSKYVKVVYSFQAGDVLEIDNAAGLVKINGVRAMDKLDWQHSEFFALPAGESILQIFPLGICTAIMAYRPRWL